MKRRGVAPARSQETDLWRFGLRSALLAFVFLRFFFDGFTHPLFNATTTVVSCGLVAIHLIRCRFEESLSIEEVILFAFFVVCLLSSAASPIANSGITFSAQMLGSWALLFLWLRAFRSEDSERVWRALLTSGLLIVAYGVYQYHWGLEATRTFVAEHPEFNYPPTFLDRLRSDRIFSTFVYPNAFACYLVMLLPLALWACRIRWRRCGADAVLVCLAAYCLWRTGSIGGMLVAAVVVQVFILSLFLRGTRLAAVVSVLLVLEGALAVAVWQAGMAPRVLSVTDRLGYWTSAWRMWNDRPLLGFGPENFGAVFPAYKLPDSMEAKHAHSLLFETLAETGSFGTLLLFAFFALVLWRIVSAGDAATAWIRAVGLSLVAGLLHNLNDFDFANPALASFLFVLCGWAISCRGGIPRPIPLTNLASVLIICVLAVTVAGAARMYLSRTSLEAALAAKTFEERWALLERAERFFPHDRVYCERGDLLLAVGRDRREFLPAAVAAYRSALALNPYLAKAYRRLAFIAVESGDTTEAERMYLLLHRAYPAKQQYCVEIALFYRMLGRISEAQRFLRMAESCKPVSIEEAREVERLRRLLETDGTDR